MATLSKEHGRNSWKLSWRESGGRRIAIRLGSLSKKSAEQFRIKFEELLSIRRVGGSVPAALADWINSISPELRERLERHNLVERRKQLKLGEFCKEFQESRTTSAKATQIRDRQVCSLLIERFGENRELSSISTKDAEDWQKWLTESGNKRDSNRSTLGANTVRRRTGVA